MKITKCWLFLNCFALLFSTQAKSSGEKMEKYDVNFKEEGAANNCKIELEMVSMRDGVKLFTSLYLPEKKTKRKYNFILVRSPYNNPNNKFRLTSKYIKKGIVLISQSCRGTGGSEGELKYKSRSSHCSFQAMREHLKKQSGMISK